MDIQESLVSLDFLAFLDIVVYQAFLVSQAIQELVVFLALVVILEYQAIVAFLALVATQVLADTLATQG